MNQNVAQVKGEGEGEEEKKYRRIEENKTERKKKPRNIVPSQYSYLQSLFDTHHPVYENINVQPIPQTDC